MEVARRIAKDALSSSAVPPLLTTMARAGLALITVIETDDLAAREQYDALLSHRGKLVPNCAGCTVDRLLGLLSQTMGNLDQAAAHFEDALVFCRKAGYRPELAWTCCDYADALRERDGDGDRAKAMSLLDESLAISGELGMRPLMERVLSRREILSAQLALARGTAVRAAKTKVGQSPVVQVPLSLQQMKAKRILDELKFSRSLGLRLQEAIAN